MGVDGVRILHDQGLFKEPGGGITPWHQDQIYWPLDTTDMITMWLPLVDVPEEIGSMTLVSGSHQADYRTIETISDHSESAIAGYVRAQDLPQSSYGAMRAGDATWHAGWTMHRASGNHTATVREVMTVIYFADGARITDLDTHPSAHGWSVSGTPASRWAICWPTTGHRWSIPMAPLDSERYVWFPLRVDRTDAGR